MCYNLERVYIKQTKTCFKLASAQRQPQGVVVTGQLQAVGQGWDQACQCQGMDTRDVLASSTCGRAAPAGPPGARPSSFSRQGVIACNTQEKPTLQIHPPQPRTSTQGTPKIDLIIFTPCSYFTHAAF